jgi:hypothetical protein
MRPAVSQHPNASPSPLAGEIAVVIAEFMTAQANQMHALARLAQITKDLVEGTALQSGDAALFQEIADLTAGTAPRPAYRTLAEEQAQRRETVLDLFATTDLSVYAIARRAGVDGSTPSKILRKARAAGDRRAAQGDLRRQPAADQAAPLQNSPSAPHDGLPENGGIASPARPEEMGASGTCPAKGEEVVPAPDRGEELATSDDPPPAPEQNWDSPIGHVTGLESTAVGLTVTATPTAAGRNAIDALRAANERLRQRPTEMEIADELDPEPPPRRAEPEARRGPAGLAQRAAKRVEKREEPAAPVIKVEVPTEEQVGLPILHVDKKAKTVTGPLGVWRDCTPIVLAVAQCLGDGALHNHSQLQQISGFKTPETFKGVWAHWKKIIEGLGVKVYDERGWGVRLSRVEVE